MQNINLKFLKNYYCDAVACALGEFVDVFNIDEYELINMLEEDDLKNICEYAVLKNKIAGVGELFLKVPKAGVSRDFFDKYQIVGKEILSARLMEGLVAKDIVGGRLILEVESLLEYSEGYLSKIVDLAASTDTPVLIKMGQSLKEVGKIVSKFGCSPAELLEDYGFLDRECYIYGFNFIDKEDQKLLTKYNPTLILSPRCDAESGRGAINLYNLIFNDLKFVFSSGKCYNIDMLAECKLASYNTSNLMYESGLVSVERLIYQLQSDEGDIEFKKDDEWRFENILDEKISLNYYELKNKYLALRKEIINIAIKIKEKI